MKRFEISIWVLAIGFGAIVTGCNSPSAPPPVPQSSAPTAAPIAESPAPDTAPEPAPVEAAPADPVIATIHGEVITQSEFQPIVNEGYGLKVLLWLVQRDLVHQEADRLHVVVTPEDIANEKTITLKGLVDATKQMNQFGDPTTQSDDQELTPQEGEALLQQVLKQQQMTMAEFKVLMEINAYLRKIAEPEVNAKITSEAIQEQFNITFGAKARVRYIVLGNMADASQVRRELADGKDFSDVARVHSLDRASAAIGGELPPFTVNDNHLPDVFREEAFSLLPGQVSDPIQIGDHIYIMKLVEKIPPKFAKFEEYRDLMRKELYEKTVQAAMGLMRKKLGQMAIDSLQIQDPVLRQQWQEELAQQNGSVHNMQDIRKNMDQMHSPATRTSDYVVPPATMPAAAP